VVQGGAAGGSDTPGCCVPSLKEIKRVSSTCN